MYKKIQRAALALMFGLLWTINAHAFGIGGLETGVDYVEINPEVASSANKVRVVELFWYGCPACYSAEPHVENWLKNKPENVEFVRIPAIFNNPRWALHAQAYYTAEVLGVLDDFHAPFFHAIHRFRKPMSSAQEIREFFVQIGVKGEDFDQTFSSFMVETKVRRAADLTGRYKINGVPALAVSGKYLVDGPMAKTYENMFKTVNILAEHEAERLAKR
ncbi:MAG: thiol:disulfide interchange protein DsbA/DsbL [Thiohalomonadaceae bacterium]